MAKTPKYVPVFPTDVDPPIPPTSVFDGNTLDRLDTQIRGLQGFEISFNSVVLPNADYSVTPAQMAQQGIIFGGTLSTGHNVTLPCTAGKKWRRIILNETGQTLTFLPSTGSGTFTVATGGGAWVVYDGASLFLIAGGSGGSSGVPNAPSTPGYYILQVPNSGPAVWVTPTLDMIGAAFAPSLAVNTGGSGPKEIGDTWTVNFNQTPAANTAGTTTTIKDSNGGSASRNIANPINGPSATYTRTTAGSVGVHSTVSNGVATVDTNTITCNWNARIFVGCDTAGDASGATVSGSNATLTGGSASATIAGSLPGGSGFGVGSTFTITPSGSQYGYLLCPHTSSAHGFLSGGFTFLMSRVATSIAFTNQFGQVVTMDLYRTDNLLAVAFTVSVSS